MRVYVYVCLAAEAVVTGKGAASEGSLNTSALELLKRLPGVTDVTARYAKHTWSYSWHEA